MSDHDALIEEGRYEAWANTRAGRAYEANEEAERMAMIAALIEACEEAGAGDRAKAYQVLLDRESSTEPAVFDRANDALWARMELEERALFATDVPEEITDAMRAKYAGVRVPLTTTQDLECAA